MNLKGRRLGEGKGGDTKGEVCCHTAGEGRVSPRALGFPARYLRDSVFTWPTVIRAATHG